MGIKIPIAVNGMDIPSSSPPSVPFTDGGRDIMAGGDKRKFSTHSASYLSNTSE